MRQKYIMSKAGIGNHLVIQEYAVLGKAARYIPGMPFEDDYTFIGQEDYKGEAIQKAISSGRLIATLRTDNLFPVGRFAAKIAESVITLYLAAGDCCTELSFDDIELCG